MSAYSSFDKVIIIRGREQDVDALLAAVFVADVLA